MLKLDQNVVELISPFLVGSINKGQRPVLFLFFLLLRKFFGPFFFILLRRGISSTLLKAGTSSLLSVALPYFIIAEVVKGSSYNAILLKIVNQTFQEWIPRYRARVSNQNAKSFGARDSYIHSFFVAQKSNLAPWITSYHCNYNDLFLPALKSING